MEDEIPFICVCVSVITYLIYLLIAPPLGIETKWNSESSETVHEVEK